MISLTTHHVSWWGRYNLPMVDVPAWRCLTGLEEGDLSGAQRCLGDLKGTNLHRQHMFWCFCLQKFQGILEYWRFNMVPPIQTAFGFWAFFQSTIRQLAVWPWEYSLLAECSLPPHNSLGYRSSPSWKRSRIVQSIHQPVQKVATSPFLRAENWIPKRLLAHLSLLCDLPSSRPECASLLRTGYQP